MRQYLVYSRRVDRGHPHTGLTSTQQGIAGNGLARLEYVENEVIDDGHETVTGGGFRQAFKKTGLFSTEHPRSNTLSHATLGLSNTFVTNIRILD